MLFWIDYVLTRPLGALFADWFSVPPSEGGLGWGADWVTFGSTALIVILVAFGTIRTQTRTTTAAR